VASVRTFQRRNGGDHAGGRQRPRPAAPPAPWTGLLELQRRAGNRAVTSVLGRPTVQRYDSGEHAQMGSDEVVVVNGVSFTQKQMTAMADLYDTVDDMKKASPAELQNLKKLIDTQTSWYETGGRKGSDVSHGQWGKATGGRYLKLAADNEEHFGPGQLSAGRDHRTAWRRYHARAMLTARAAAAAAGGQSIPVPAEAKLVNDFGNHFLTDAFSVGHLLAKKDLMAESQKSFDALAHTDGIVFHQNVFTDRVAEIVMRDPKAQRAFGDRYLKLIEWDSIDAERLSEFLFQMARREPTKFYSVFAKMVHDQMNDSIAAVPGSAIEVENDHGDTWYLSGDGTLDRSPRTLGIIQQAIHQADVNLEEAAASPDLAQSRPAGGVDTFWLRLPEFFQRVWSYTPRLTSLGQQKANAIEQRSTDAGGRAAAELYAGIIIKQLPTAIEELTAAGYLIEKSKFFANQPAPPTYGD
jgi:hypothetical protein